MWRRWAVRLMVLGACLLFVTGMASAPAVAHTALISSDPADGSVLTEAPKQATLTFNEPVTVPPGAVEVFGPDSQPLKSSVSARGERVTIELPRVLESGSHVVAWRVVSADGHPIAGSLTFSVGEPTALPAVPDGDSETEATARVAMTVTQILLYVGFFIAGGLALFTAWILPARVGQARIRGRLRVAVRLAASTAALGALTSYPASLAHQLGGPFADLLSSEPWSGLTASTVAGFVLMLLGIVMILRTQAGRVDRVGTRRALAVFGVGLGAVSFSLTGHTRGFEPLALMVATDVAHVLAGCVWLGGLVGLALTLRALSDQPGAAFETLSRFSSAAAGTLVILFISGAVLSWRILGGWSPLFDSGYGYLLLTKLGVVGLAVALACWNRFVLMPRAARHRDERTLALRMLSRTVLVEAVLIAGSLTVTGLLVSESPGGERAGGTQSASTSRMGENTAIGRDPEVPLVAT